MMGLKELKDSTGFRPELMLIGETALLIDTKELCFCFKPGECQKLKISEEVDKETADKLIECITEFISQNPRFPQ